MVRARTILVGHQCGGNHFLSFGGDKLNQLQDDRKPNARAIPIINLQAANFLEFQFDVDNKNLTFCRYYDGQTHEAFVYELSYSSHTQHSSITTVIGIIDPKGIKVTGNATLNVT